MHVMQMKIENLNAVNEKQTSHFKKLFAPDNLQFKDSNLIAECHLNEKPIIHEIRAQLKTLQANFQKCYNEYKIAENNVK